MVHRGLYLTDDFASNMALFCVMRNDNLASNPGQKAVELADPGRREPGHRITYPQAFTQTIIKLLPWEIAHLTNNIPTPMWYDPDAGLRFGFLVVPLLVVIYLVQVVFNKNGRGIHDLIAKTVVVCSCA